MSFQTVLEEIRVERAYQDDEWGMEFDDNNTLNDWVTYIMIYVSQAARMDVPHEGSRKNMLKAATLAVAAIESFDRNGQFAPRHYEDRVPAGTRPGDESSKSRLATLRDEIAIIRMAVERLLDGVETDADLMQRIPSFDALIQTIERLVRTAAILECQRTESEGPG